MANTVKVGITAEDQGFKSTMDSMMSSANSFGQSLDTAGGKTKTLNGALREAKKEAMNLAMAYNQLSDAAKSSDFGVQMKKQLDMALQAAGQLQDIKGDVAAEISNLASDTMAWDATAQGIGVVSSGLQGLASAYGLVGGNVEKFAQALVTVNAVQSVANTIIGIGNALQKQSALMVGLRAAKNAIFGASEVAATTAETANTAATAANTAATGANTTAKGANAAANTGQVAALGAATTAQLANNAAVLANPYVACAVAVAALTAAIVAWCVSSQEATQEQLSLTAATEAFEKEAESTMKTAGEQISTFMSLKKTYDECGGQVDVLKKKIIDNTEAQRKLGVTVKTVDDVHKLFGKNSKNYCDWAMARARAMAAEAAQAAILGEILAELTKIQAAMMRGEEVDYVDFEKILKKGGLNSTTINRLVKEAGGDIEWDYIWSNLDASKMDWGKFMNAAMNEIMQNGAGKVLQDMINTAQTEMDVASADFGSMLDANDKKIKSGGKSAKSAAKGAGDEVAKVLTSLEGCDAIIQDAEKEMKKLNSTSADYAEKMKRLKDVILTARIAKLNLLDKSTVEGLTQSKSLIEQIIKSLPEGSDAAKTMQDELDNVNEKLYGMYALMSQRGDIKSLKTTKSQVEAIIDSLPDGSDELQKWVTIWKQINDKILAADQKIKDLKDGVQEGSKTWLDREIKRIQTEIDKLDPNAEGNMNIRATLELNKQDLQFQLNKLEQDSTVTVVGELKLNELDRSYKMTAFEQLSKQFEKLKAKREELKTSLEKAISVEEYNKISNSISNIDAELTQLQKKINLKELTDDIKNYKKEVANMSYDSLKNGIQGLGQMYDSISGLADKLSECEDPLEGIFAIFDTIFGVVDTIKSFVEGIEQLTETFNMLRGAKDALTASTVKNTVVTQLNTSTTESAAAAQSMKAAADTQEAGAALGNAAANTAEAGSEAASQMSSMGPFGWIAGIAAALAIAGALFGIISQAKGFATGGIIDGSTTMGDKVLARVNSGEMIINQRQQSRLFKMIDHGNLIENDGPQVSTVRIKGSDIYLALKNYGKVTNKKL